MGIPASIRTERLLLRRWRIEDATQMLAALEANVTHLQPWIPPHVALPAPPPEIALRLAGFIADFETGRGWRYGIFSPDEAQLFGEVSLFPRGLDGRVPFAEADRVEIGYWLRKDVTGQGFATEAARAMFELAGTLPGIGCVEVRCDAMNVRSAAIPERLGFQLAALLPVPGRGDAPPSQDMIWQYVLPASLPHG